MFYFSVIKSPVVLDQDTITGRIQSIGSPDSKHRRVTLRRYLHGFEIRLKVAVEIEGKERIVHDDTIAPTEIAQWRALEDRAFKAETKSCESIRNEAVQALKLSGLWQ